jgi:hypothetical protein
MQMTSRIATAMWTSNPIQPGRCLLKFRDRKPIHVESRKVGTRNLSRRAPERSLGPVSKLLSNGQMAQQQFPAWCLPIHTTRSSQCTTEQSCRVGSIAGSKSWRRFSARMCMQFQVLRAALNPSAVTSQFARDSRLSLPVCPWASALSSSSVGPAWSMGPPVTVTHSSQWVRGVTRGLLTSCSRSQSSCGKSFRFWSYVIISQWRRSLRHCLANSISNWA